LESTVVIASSCTSEETLANRLRELGLRARLLRNLPDLLAEIYDVRIGCLILREDFGRTHAYELISLIRLIRPDLPVIVTARDNMPDLELRYRLGAVLYYHIQSMGTDDLIAAVKSCFQAKPQLRVLLVDDDTDYMRAIQSILETRSYQAIPALDSFEALRKISLFAPDVVLVDLIMRGMWDGIRLRCQLRGDGRYRDIPVLMMTSLANDPDELARYTFHEVQAEEFLPKPIQADELIRRISQVCHPKVEENE
jgi:CheY-like chemotaxis protein